MPGMFGSGFYVYAAGRPLCDPHAVRKKPQGSSSAHGNLAAKWQSESLVLSQRVR